MPPLPAPLAITTGLLPGQVLQRNLKNIATANIEGVCGQEKGEVIVRTSGAKLRAGKWVKAGSAAHGQWQAVLQLPAGGPYRVEFRIGTGRALVVKDIFCGDVWILAGQSNMEGVGLLSGRSQTHPQVRAFDFQEKWTLARDPLHRYHGSPHTVYNPPAPDETTARQWEANKKVKGTGPGLFFGTEMRKRTGVPQGLIPCAVGGTGMVQWDPDGKAKGGETLYGAMLLRWKRQAQPVAGVLWYQGENEATTNESEFYLQAMEKFIPALRADLGNAGLPIVMTQIGRVFYGDQHDGWFRLREAQRQMAARFAHLLMVPSIDLPLVDSIHLDSPGHQLLTRRYADAACVLLGLKKQGRLPIVAVEARVVPSDIGPGQMPQIEITFRHVKGKLAAPGTPLGFVVHSNANAYFQEPFKVKLRGNKVLLEQDIPAADLVAGWDVCYGFRLSAPCNIRDEAGMGLPAFQLPILPLR